MNKCFVGLLVLGLSGYVGAAPMHNTAMQMNSYQSEYQASMQAMDREMMPAMQANNPDVAFAQGMLAHHKGAVKMAQIQLKYGHNEQMRKLARKIIREQQDQINVLQEWLQHHH